MIPLKRTCEIVLIDENNRDEKFELVDVLSLEDNALCGIFEATISFSDVFYTDDFQQEINFAVKTKVQLKVTVDLDNLSVNDFSLLKLDILNIDVQRIDVLKYIEDLISAYYSSKQYNEYALYCVPTVHLIEKGFEV